MGIGLPVENGHLVVEDGAILTSLGPDLAIYFAEYDNQNTGQVFPDKTEGWTFSGHTNSVVSVTVCDDYVFSGGYDNYVRQINKGDGSAGWTYNEGDTIRGLSTGVNNNYVYLASDASRIKQLNISDGSEGWTNSNPSDMIFALETGNNGNYLYTTEDDGTVRRVNLSDGTDDWITSVNDDRTRSIGVGPNDNYIYVGTQYTNNYVQQLDATDGSEGWTFDVSDRPEAVAAGIDNNWVYSGVASILQQIAVSDGNAGWSNNNSIADIRGLAVGPNNKIYSGAASIRKIDTSDGTEDWALAKSTIFDLAIG